jgi:outer membrane protein OmpA-like peptidoglycan-associated protein
MGFISRHMSETGMNMNGLASLLQRESSTYRSALPSGLSEIFWPAKTATATASPVIAQAVQRESSSNWLLPALAAAALALGFLWLFSHARRPAIPQVALTPRGEASRFAIPTPNLTCALPAGVTLAAGGAESRLLALVQDPAAKLGDTWFNGDQLSFDSGSSKLKSGSQTELNDIASILTNCPNVRLTVAGYTDSVGNPEGNLRLSRNRANAVVAQLTSRGVSTDRLVSEGYGEQYPVADNTTAEGRAQNRRVAMRVTQK